MVRSLRFITALALLVLLSGCDLRDKIPLTPEDARRLADPFGAATRERVPGDEPGDTYEVLVESRRKGSWASAELAIRRQLSGLCPDGQRPAILERSPALLSDSIAARNVDHPKGTSYRLKYLCPAQPYEELTFAPGTSRRDAEGQVFAELTGEEWPPGRRAIATSLPVSKWVKKYEWMNEIIGMEVSRQLPLCPDGVIVRRVLIGNYAPGDPPQRGSDDRTEFVFGFLSDCRTPQP
ncbi:MAG TPA: hypothetical protein VIM90_01920 [Arenimonas sp.]|tara:strand:+ start:2155 stop:2865 length:711 start_codon:yes stop_codon:yes gene_type:complete